MNCKKTCALLTAYLDAELTLKQGEQIKTHLSACSSCRQQAEVLASLRTKLHQALETKAGEAVPSPQTWANIAKRIDTRKSPATALLESFNAWFFRHSAWKVAFISIFAVVLVIGLNALQLLVPQSSDVVAKSLVENSRDVKAALNGEKITDVEVVTRLVDENGKVLVAWVRTESNSILTEVDLKTNRIINTIPVQVPDITPGDKERILEIAMADHRIQQFLAQGAIIPDFQPGHSFNTREVVASDGSIRTEWTVSIMGTLQIKIGKSLRLATVDLEKGSVIGISNAATVRLNWGSIIASKVAPYLITLGILILIGIALKNKVAEKAAGITSILFGMVSLGGLVSMPSETIYLILLLGIPFIGLIIGIVDVRRRHTGKWIAIVGIVLCSVIGGFELFAAIMGVLASNRRAELIESISLLSAVKGFRKQ
jgi:hypothetical protein